MAKQTILVCDRKHHGLVPAIGTFGQLNGPSKAVPTVDLCAACAQELFGSSTMNGETPEQRRKRLDRERHARKRVETQKPVGLPNHSNKAYWPTMEAKVMAVVNELQEQIHIRDIVKGSELTYATVSNTLRRLVSQGKVGTTGGVGRYRRYHLAK